MPAVYIPFYFIPQIRSSKGCGVTAYVLWRKESQYRSVSSSVLEHASAVAATRRAVPPTRYKTELACVTTSSKQVAAQVGTPFNVIFVLEVL